MSAEDLSTDSCGATLAQAREAAGVSQRDVADALHLPVHVVDAMEVSDKTRLPAYVFTRGYVRAYAKLLDLDPDPLVTALSFEYGTSAEERATPVAQMRSLATPGFFSSLVSNLKKPNIMRQLPVLSLVLGGVVVIIALVFLISMFGAEESSDADSRNADRDNEDTATASVAGDTSSQVIAADAVNVPRVTDNLQVATPAGADQEHAQAAAIAADDAAAATSSSAAGEGMAVSALTANTDITPGTTTVRRLTAAGNDRLTLQFTDKCWVEIKDNQGTVLFGDLGQPGQTLEFAGAGPFGVKLGYASGVIMLYNAEPVALTAHTRNNVAKLVIGQ